MVAAVMPKSKSGEFTGHAMGQSVRIVTSLLPGLITAKSFEPDVAVVVDVLRATSVMTAAFGSGVKQIFTCCDVLEAVSLADQIASCEQGNQRPLLCGERSCKPIFGFDYGNSPSEYTPSRVRGKTMILTTTNGTKAIQAASSAKRLITASFLNLPTVVKVLRGAGLVHLVCSGTDGQITGEDVMLVGAIIDACRVEYMVELEDDESRMAFSFWSSCVSMSERSPWVSLKNGKGKQISNLLAKLFGSTLGGANLSNLGFGQDLERCAQIGTQSVVGVRSQQNPTAFDLLAWD